MDKIRKLLKKISRSDWLRLLTIIEQLLSGKLLKSKIKKVKGTDFYRIRSGRFRIIFHYQGRKREIIIDSIKLRGEDTYRI